MTSRIMLKADPYTNFILYSRMQEPALKQAMAQHPNARTFTVVTTNVYHTFSFVPNHLTRFIPESALRLFTMDYPQDEPLVALEREAEKLQNNIPNHITFENIIHGLIGRQTRISEFHNVLTAIKHAKEYTPNRVTLMTYLYGEITKQFRARIAPHVNRARKQFKSLGVTMDNQTDVVITLSGKPLESADAVWDWLRLTPETADRLSREDAEKKQKCLYALGAALDRLIAGINNTEWVSPESYIRCCDDIQREIHYEAGDHL